jgi:phosphocarrier protein HPr
VPETTVVLPNPTGLHARPAKVFAKAAASFPGDVVVSKDGREVNAKSVLSVLTLDCHQGDQIVIRVSGEGAEEALEELVALVESGLGEAEGEAG